MPNAVIAHSPDGAFDLDALPRAKPPAGPASTAWTSCRRSARPSATTGTRRAGRSESGYGRRLETRFHVVAVDYGVKRNILRLLNDCGCSVTVVPATASAEEILALRPDGVFLSNGPGDPAATGVYAVPTIKALLETKIPLFGICLGHQLLGLAVGARTVKMPQGHHGANHPVKDFTTGKVEIVSMNHGFAVDRETPAGQRRGDPCLAVRRLELRRRADRPPGLLGAVPPGGLARPPRQPLPLPPLRRPHCGVEGGIAGGVIPCGFEGEPRGAISRRDFNLFKPCGTVSAPLSLRMTPPFHLS